MQNCFYMFLLFLGAKTQRARVSYSVTQAWGTCNVYMAHSNHLRTRAEFKNVSQVLSPLFSEWIICCRVWPSRRVHLMVNEQLSTYLNCGRPCRTEGKRALVHYLTAFSLLLHLWLTAEGDPPRFRAPLYHWPWAPFCQWRWPPRRSIRIPLHPCQLLLLNPQHRCTDLLVRQTFSKALATFILRNISEWKLAALNVGTTLTPVDNTEYYSLRPP